MDRLTREEILPYVENAKARIRLNAGEDVESVERRNAAIHDLRVHELALQSLSQEAVRDEALEEAARLVEKRAASLNVVAMSRGEISEADQDAIRFAELRKTDAAPMARYVRLAADAIRALKREPNAAASEGPARDLPCWSVDGPAPAAPDVLGEQPTHFEMARTRMLRKRIADIVATHDAFVADHTNRERAEALRHAIDKARGISLTKAEQEKQEDYDCPHAYPHRYCETCKVDPCPLGLGKKSPPAPGASDD